MKSIIFSSILFLLSRYSEAAATNYVEDQLRSLKSIAETRWDQIKSLIDAQDRRFEQFEKMIDTIDRRIDRLIGSEGRKFEICVTPNGNERENLVIGDVFSCPDSWKAYRNEKCYKFFFDSKNHGEASDFCKYQSTSEYNATLASIRDSWEQEFVEQYVFVENKPNDNVWIGVKRDALNRSLVWEDGSHNAYTNWDPADHYIEGNDCIELMRPTTNTRENKLGKWKSSLCRGKNLILCSMVPTHHRRPSTRPTPDIRPPNSRLPVNERDIPYGFIYIQLPSQSEPRILWPNYDWEEVSRLYAGHFFRVEGGGSEKFGVTQSQSAPTLNLVQHKKRDNTRGVIYRDEQINIPEDGEWSDYLYAGDRDYERHEARYLRFKLNSEEVRPTNQAIRVWKRI